MGDILCFGELLLRLSPTSGSGWLEQARLPVYLGGAELNVASALAVWGLPAAYCTVLPDNFLSASIRDVITNRGVDISRLIAGGSRVGLYYLPQGADMQRAGVVYDRAYSAFSMLKPGQIDWEATLEGISYFHFSAITPALNQNLAEVCREALAAAARRNITISVDLNYRAALWASDRLPHTVMPDLVRHCDIIMGNIWSAKALLDTAIAPETLATPSMENYLAQATRTAAELQGRFPRCKAVANTFRFDRPEGGLHYYASLDTGGRQYHSTPRTCEAVTDRVGSGDCFMAGLLHGFYLNNEPRDIIEFAATAAVMKTAETGDATANKAGAIRANMNL